jgi:hypothetical protein
MLGLKFARWLDWAEQGNVTPQAYEEHLKRICDIEDRGDHIHTAEFAKILSFDGRITKKRKLTYNKAISGENIMTRGKYAGKSFSYVLSDPEYCCEILKHCAEIGNDMWSRLVTFLRPSTINYAPTAPEDQTSEVLTTVPKKKSLECGNTAKVNVKTIDLTKVSRQNPSKITPKNISENTLSHYYGNK